MRCLGRRLAVECSTLFVVCPTAAAASHGRDFSILVRRRVDRVPFSSGTGAFTGQSGRHQCSIGAPEALVSLAGCALDLPIPVLGLTIMAGLAFIINKMAHLVCECTTCPNHSVCMPHSMLLYSPLPDYRVHVYGRSIHLRALDIARWAGTEQGRCAEGSASAVAAMAAIWRYGWRRAPHGERGGDACGAR